MSDEAQYQVLARKYRPQSFADLIGQEAMVRVLRNAFASGRIAHAFMMTGVRGIGKTTTARIIAKGLNCIGADGQNTEATTEPCGVCAPCRAIADGRSMDVLELDAASNTQVDKMREILAGVPYRPSETRYKIYIFDEVHMLSNSAFNALLKTLEEPPEHVKFIFATTEIRKVPVTVLSRCQRFDLKRVEPDVLSAHLAKISQSENVAVAPDALRLITRAAEGSVRDALSLLDQAIAMGDGETSVEQVREMMGLADHSRILDLFDAIVSGEVTQALETLRALYFDGADAGTLISELAEVAHWISLLKISDQLDEDLIAPEELARGREFASKLELASLARMWQMLLKLGKEIELAPNRLMGAEMAIIRLCHVADQPPPGELLAKLKAAGALEAMTSGKSARTVQQTGQKADAPKAMRRKQAGGADIDETALARFTRFEDVVALIRKNRDVGLLMEVESYLRVESYRPGVIEFALAEGAPSTLPAQLAKRLADWTGARWGISLIPKSEALTIREEKARERDQAHAHAEETGVIALLKSHFPKAEIIDIARPKPLENEPEIDDIPDSWDPIDSDDL